MKKPRAGKPVKSPNKRPDLRLFKLLGGEVRSILRQNDAPAHWDDSEVKVLIEFALFPGAFDAVQLTRTESGVRYKVAGIGSGASPDQMVLNALHLAKMLVEGREALLKALPRIVKRIGRYWRDPRKRIQLEWALAREFGSPLAPPLRKLWTATAKELAEESNKAWQPGKTLAEKIVECGALHLEEMTPESREAFLSGLRAEVRAALIAEFGQRPLTSESFWKDPETRERAYALMRRVLFEYERKPGRGRKQFTEDVIDKARKDLQAQFSAE